MFRDRPDRDIAVLGDGGWGTTLALLLCEKGYRVTLWGAFPRYVKEMGQKRENVKFLPGFRIPEPLRLSHDLEKTCGDHDTIVLATPSQFMRSVVRRIPKRGLRDKVFVSVAKGIEKKTLCVMSQVIHEELGNQVHLAVLSGPAIAREIALKNPAAVSVASKNKKLASLARQIFTTDALTVYESSDVLGVELGGALKNVIAISAGIVEGLGFGSNTRAALFARGVAEMARLGHRMGANKATFMGLSGLGDLATTCLSPLSRNRWLGEEIGKGKTLRSILRETEMVVEGVDTCESACRLAKKYKVSMPITQAVHEILFRNEDPRHAVKALMKREFRRELD